MKTWAIGDLHGHFDQWIRLYNKIKANGFTDDDQLVFLGDYIDGGPQTKELLTWLIEYKKAYPQTVCLYGNHEDLMLDALDYDGKIYGSYDLWYHQGGKATYESYIPKDSDSYSKAIMQVKDTIPQEHRDWLMALPLYYQTDKYFFVHAGVLPNKSLKEQTDLVDKGDKDMIETFIWIRDQFIYSVYDWDKKIIFGHTVHEEPYKDNYKIGLDGMFHNDGNIFALALPEEVIYTESSKHI